MHNTLSAQLTGPYRLLDVKVLRCVLDRGRFRWSVRERDGRVLEASLHSYGSEAEAFRAGNAAARAIRMVDTLTPGKRDPLTLWD